MVLILLQVGPAACLVLQWTHVINGWLVSMKKCQSSISKICSSGHCFLRVHYVL